MSVHITLLCISGSLVIWSYWSLLIDLRRGRKQPLATRVALSCASTLGFTGVLLGERNWGDLAFSGINASLSIYVAWRSIKLRDTHVSRADKACLAISVVGTIVWAASDQADMGIAFAIAADIVAFFPVFGKIWREPETQPVPTYFIGFVAAATALVADMHRGPLGANSAFTIYLMCIDLLLPLATLAMRAVRDNPPHTAPEEALQLKA